MGLRWMFLAPAVCLAAGVANVNVVGSTNVQSVLSYVAPDNSACTLEVSESASLRPLVHDVDPAIFPGSDSDQRTGNVANGASRVFVIGKRAVEQGADGKWYSRALQTNTAHYYRLHCGSDVMSGSFRTSNIPAGISYPWPVPQDPQTGNFRWPSTDGNDRSQTVIDPNYGTLIRRVSVPGDAPASVDTAHKPFASAVGAQWNNPAGALQDDGSAASYSGTTQDWLTLTGSGLQGLADFYLGAAGLDSITVRIKGSSAGATDGARTVDVCLTLDGVNCRGQIRKAELDSAESVKTLGGGAPLDLWGGDALWPVDVARNPKFGVMIRASQANQTSLSIQYVEVDAAFSQMVLMPEGGFLQVCSATRSNGGYRCTFQSSLSTNQMYWIRPETGEVRWLGQLIATNWGGDQALCGSSFAYFDNSDPNVYYCEANLNGKAVLLKGVYQGNDAAVPAGTIAPFTWTNLTPPGNTIPELIQKFDPSYDPNTFPPSLGLMTDHYFVYRAWQAGQDSRAWLAVFDAGNGQPVGTGGTGQIVAATRAYSAPNTRWCGTHTLEFTGHNQWFGWDATTMQNGGNDATGPFTVNLMTDLPAATGTFTIQVSGEPSPYIMDAQVGDLFQVSNAPWPGWDFLRITQKLTATQWVVERTVTKTTAVAQPAGTALTAFCGARQLSNPNQGAYVYWDFLNDPHGTDTTGTHWVVETQLTGGHIVQRGDYRIMEASDGYSVVTPGFPKSFNSQRSFRISGNPQWRGVYANQIPEGLGLGFMQHESYENWAAIGAGRSNWFVDMIPFIGTSYLVSALSQVQGSNQVYQVNSPKIHRDIFPIFALCGARQLKDVSPGPIRDADNLSYCAGSACAAGAGPGDVFVNCPQPVTAQSTCTPFSYGDPTSVCVGDMMPYGQSITQYFLDSGGLGLRNRVLTNALYAWHGPRTMGYFDTAYSLPDGSWVIFASWGSNGRKDLYMVKVPPQPAFESDPRWGLQPMTQTVSEPVPAGTAQVRFAFGDSGAFGGTTAAQTCSGNCSITLSAPPLSLIFAQPSFLDAGGLKLSDGSPTSRVNGGVSGTGIGKPVLAAGNAVTNAFSYLPAIAPGGIVSIFGQDLADCEIGAIGFPLTTSMCQAGVTFNGQAAPLFYTGANQINAQVPASVQPNQDLTVVVSRDGVASDPFVVPAAQIGAVAPALANYTLDGTVFRALVQNPDGTMSNQRPLRRGETGLVFANALGATTPAVPDGQAAPAEPQAKVNAGAQVYVNGFAEQVAFAQLVPGSVALYEVSFKLDANTPLRGDDTNEIWLDVGGVESPHLRFSAQ